MYGNDFSSFLIEIFELTAKIQTPAKIIPILCIQMASPSFVQLSDRFYAIILSFQDRWVVNIFDKTGKKRLASLLDLKVDNPVSIVTMRLGSNDNDGDDSKLTSAAKQNSDITKGLAMDQTFTIRVMLGDRENLWSHILGREILRTFINKRIDHIFKIDKSIGMEGMQFPQLLLNLSPFELNEESVREICNGFREKI